MGSGEVAGGSGFGKQLTFISVPPGAAPCKPGLLCRKMYLRSSYKSTEQSEAKQTLCCSQTTCLGSILPHPCGGALPKCLAGPQSPLLILVPVACV